MEPVHSMVKKIKNNDLHPFIESLMKSSQVFAPQKIETLPEPVTSFQKVSSPENLFLDSPVEFTAREIFFPKGEVIVEFKQGEAKEPSFLKENSARKILFGLRFCDLSAIHKQDIAFSSGKGDPYYSKRRENTILMGYHQQDCGDKYCYCNSIDLEFSFDLIFYKKEKYYLVETGSKEGEEILEEFKSFFSDTDYLITEKDREIENELKLKNKNLDGLYENDSWKALVDRCLSCGLCNCLCPTCFCFEFKDVVEDGQFKKIRNHSECHFDCFTRVAGDHVFRAEKEHKFKHRIFHQLDYFKKDHGESLCTGCGRCIRYCPTKIDFITALNEMGED